MAVADRSTIGVDPKTRQETVEQIAALDALTFTTPTAAEVVALRDAISAALAALFGSSQ